MNWYKNYVEFHKKAYIWNEQDQQKEDIIQEPDMEQGRSFEVPDTEGGLNPIEAYYFFSNPNSPQAKKVWPKIQRGDYPPSLFNYVYNFKDNNLHTRWLTTISENEEILERDMNIVAGLVHAMLESFGVNIFATLTEQDETKIEEILEIYNSAPESIRTTMLRMMPSLNSQVD